MHPWYLLWAAPLLALHPSRGLLAWTALAPLAYLLPELSAAGSIWAAIIPWIEYLPVLAGFALDLRRGGTGSRAGVLPRRGAAR